MGEKQRKKQRKKQKKKQRYIRNIRASKPSPIASPGTMTPVPISFPGDDTTLSPKVDGITGCAHVERGVKLEKVRTWFQTEPPPQCQSCTSSHPSKAEAGAKKDLWICLACGYVGCGWHSHDAQDGTPLNLGSGHIRAHRKQLTHPIVMQWGDSLDCWCLDCDIQLMYLADVATSTRSTLLRKAAALLQESISRHSSTLLKVESGQVELGQAESDHADPGPSESGQPDSGVVAEQQPSKFAARPFVSRRVIKGLTNLGNTCFFNSVMQNLVGVSMLREHFRQESSVQEGVLKKSLRTFFQDMDPPGDGADGGSGRTIHTRSFGSSVGTAVSPRVLFSAICTKAPRFKGFQQQDSHELLRCLLDGLHMEEESMRKSVVGSHGPEDGPAKVPDTFVEHMFGMQLSSTVSCCECGHSSVVYEPYLDLSLPIPSKQERSKSESIRVQLPKLIAPRSQVGTASGSGVSSVHPAPFDSGLVDSTQPGSVSDPEHARPAPVHGCSLGPFSVLDGGAVNSGSLHDAVEKQVACTSGDGEGSMVQGSADSPSTPSRCEVVSEAGGAAACSSGSGESKGWLDFVGDTSQGMAGESAAMSFLDQRVDSSASGAPASDASEAFGIGGFSGSRVEEIVDHSSGDMFSVQGGGVREALDDGNPMEEETIEYGPQLPGAGYRVEQQSECLELVIFRPDGSSLPSALTDPSCLDGTSSGSREVSSSSDPKSGALVPAEDDGDFGGVASLFDDGNSFSRDDPSSPYHFGSASPSFSPFDSIASVPSFSSDLGQIFGGRAVPVGGVREVEPYPIMSLEGCLQAFTKTEVLSGENAWGCENCTRLAHGPLRDPDPSEEAMDTNGSIDLADTDGEFEPRSASVGTSAVDATREAVDVEGDGTHGEWESLVVEDRVMEDLSASTNSLSIVIVPQARDASAETSNNGYSMLESSPHESADAEQTASPRMGSDGGGGSSSAALGPAVVPPLSKSHNTLKRSQSLDCFADSSSAKGSEFPPSRSSNENENAEEPYVLVESLSVSADAVEDDTASRNGRRRRNNTGVSSKEAQGRPGKVCDRGVEACAKPGAKASPKLVTVKRDATKRFLISKAPLVLTVHLKRFAQDLHGRLSKLSGHITFHEQLDLGPFVDQRDGVKGDGVYQLIGTVEHSGTMRGGHYVAYVKGQDSSSVEPGAEPSSDGGSAWYYISDSHVRKTSLESVLQSEAYLLFYERRTFE